MEEQIIGQTRGGQHYGDELKGSDEQKAQRLVTEMLGKGGWTEAEWKRRPKGDAKKGRQAARLRAETTMTWSWIAARLNMGHWRTALNATQAALLEGARQ